MLNVSMKLSIHNIIVGNAETVSYKYKCSMVYQYQYCILENGYTSHKVYTSICPSKYLKFQNKVDSMYGLAEQYCLNFEGLIFFVTIIVDLGSILFPS